MDILALEKLCRLLRDDILTATTTAGSGHPTSSMSAVELAATLFFGGFFHYNPTAPQSLSNDRFILSKGHAAPLLYSLYHAAGWISRDELLALRTFASKFEGHPTPRIPWVDIATGSLGQGLSAGVGMALGINVQFQISNFKLKIPKVFVLLGDSEMAEGQVWEATEIAGYYKLNNLIAILDVNRLGQRGETMEGWDLATYANRFEAFGWRAVIVKDGHNLEKVHDAYVQALKNGSERPTIIIAKTNKGHGVSFLQNKDDWHGKPVPKDRLDEALKELGEVDLELRGEVLLPSSAGGKNRERRHEDAATWEVHSRASTPTEPSRLMSSDPVATREAYGEALVGLGKLDERVVAFDGEVSNSTYADKFKKAFPERFFEMFIAEQNMVTAALGASKVGLIPFVSTFAAFLTRAADQIRMAQYSNPNLKLVGSHAGVSIGSDGASQMALEDIALMRAVQNSVVFYPSDAVSTAALTQIMAKNDGLFYLRTTREKTPVLYAPDEPFKIGGSKTLKESANDSAVVLAAGITLHEALKAQELLQKEHINIAVVDLYSIKPLDKETIRRLAKKTEHVVVVEDHYQAGGIGEAVGGVLSRFTHLCVRRLPHSGTPAELLAYEEIDATAIMRVIKDYPGR